MLIQPYQSASSAPVSGVRLSGRAERFQEIESLMLELSGDGDSITITRESYASYEQMTYTAEASTFGETGGMVQSQTAMLSQLKQDYLQMVQQRVMEILTQSTNNQLPASGNNRAQSNKTVSLRSMIEYRQTAVYSMDKTTIAGLDNDYSAEATANRIIQFALSFYDGGNRQEYTAEIRNAIIKGFEQASQMLGELPEISQDTMDLINERLNAFAQGQELSLTA